MPDGSAPGRSTDIARPQVGVLLYLVSVGLVAAAITAVCFGIGLFLLAPPARETIADVERNRPRAHGSAPDAGREAVMASPQAAARDVLPGSPTGQRAGADQAANGKLPAESASVSEPASSAALSPPTPTPFASSPPSAAAAAVFFGGAKGHPARYGRSPHARTASQHPRPRSARSAPTLTPPQSPLAQTLTPPQTISFGQLLAQLTGKTEPVGQTPTPPQPEGADPFAQRALNK